MSELSIEGRHERSERFYGHAALLCVIALVWLLLASGAWSAGDQFAGHQTHGAASLTRLADLPVMLMGWGLMTVAMMLPATIPFVDRFRRAVEDHLEVHPLVGLLIAGYLAVWMLVGATFTIVDIALMQSLEVFDASEALTSRIAPLALAAAGIWQLTTSRRYFLHRPYAPRVVRAGFQSAPRSRSIRAGFEHGLDCVGGCGPLMLAMFAIGYESVPLMAFVSVALIAEKNTAWGHELRAPIGLAVIAAAVGMAFV